MIPYQIQIIRLIYKSVSGMDLKKNHSSNIQNPSQIKNGILGNPLISIANASTPVRKRLIKPGSQMNSTPVNIHKIGSQIKSPTLSNKQNSEVNSVNNKMGIKRPKITEKNINLSPIMALNRKMSEGPRLEKRSFTPTGIKKQESLSSLLDQNSGDDYQTNNEYMMQGNEMNNSNCFKNMLGNRAKTPIRNNGLSESRQSNFFGAFKSSQSNSNLNNLNSRLRESRSSNLMSSSGSFESFKSGSQIRQNQVACINEHEKKAKAKYKVIEENDDDDDILVYCSRCAILLVKKGFKVEELTHEDIMKIKGQNRTQEDRLSNRSSNNEYYNYADQTARKLKIRLEQISAQREAMFSIHDKALDDIDCYYNSIIALIEEQKARDKEQVMMARDQDKNSGEILQIKIGEAINKLDSMLRSKKVSASSLESIQNMESIMTYKCPYTYRLNNNPVLDNIQYKFQKFSQLFLMEYKLNFEGDDGETLRNYSSTPVNYKNSEGECPLRFSFQKKLREQKNHEFGFPNNGFRGHFKKESEKIEQMEGQDSGQLSNGNEKKAFRTLFPEESQQDEDKQKNGIHSPTFKQF